MGCSALCIDISGIPSPQILFPIKHIQPGSKITVRTFGFLKLLRDTMAKSIIEFLLHPLVFTKKRVRCTWSCKVVACGNLGQKKMYLPVELKKSVDLEIKCLQLRQQDTTRIRGVLDAES